jgi:hypothetical protein
MSETTVERRLANLTTLQRELEELAARVKSEERTDAKRPEVQGFSWGK